jgi:hypothetical protein
MTSRNLPVLLLVVVLFIWGVNLIAEKYHLYYMIWWLDIPMHILGGAWVALLSLYLYNHAPFPRRKDHSTSFVVAAMLSSALVIGVFWEVFEYSVEHLVKLNDNGVFDTLKDLCDDMLGALLAAILFVKKGYNKHL